MSDDGVKVVVPSVEELRTSPDYADMRRYWAVLGFLFNEMKTKFGTEMAMSLAFSRVSFDLRATLGEEKAIIAMKKMIETVPEISAMEEKYKNGP